MVRTPLTLARLALLLYLAASSLSGWLRISEAGANRDWILNFQQLPGPAYFAASGALWGLVFLAALIGVLFQMRGAGWFTIGAVVFISAWRWVERLLFVRSPQARTGWVFEALLNAAVLAVIYLLMKGFPPVRTEE